MTNSIALATRQLAEEATASLAKTPTAQALPPANGPPSGVELAGPVPLPALPAVPEFPAEVLPDAFKAWIVDAADRARYRPDLAAVASMAALGSIIGRRIGIRLKAHDPWTEYGNVWAGLVGPPSALKSPAQREAMRLLKTLQREADAAHAQLAKEHELALEAQKLRRDAKRKAAAKRLADDASAAIDLNDGNALVEPVPRAYWTSNVTAEALGVLLAQNPNGLLIEHDEMSALLNSLEDERNADTRGLLLSGWSGSEGYRFDRIGRGVTSLPAFAVSVCGGIQPGPLARYVRSAYSGERADGLLQRFQLLTWPEPETFEYVDRRPNVEAIRAAEGIFRYADTFDPVAVGSTDGNNPPFVRFNPAAQELFVGWYSDFMRKHRAAEGSECAALSAHFGKYPGLVGKLCLILHVADNPGQREVPLRTLVKALEWLKYLEAHAWKVYHAVNHPETGAAQLLLSRLKLGELPPEFKAWQITRKCWHGLTDGDAVKRACRLLLEHGWLVEVDPGGATGGRPADPTYAVSPLAVPS